MLNETIKPKTQNNYKCNLNYEFFSKEGSQELFEYTQKIAEYIIEENIQNLIIADRSARPLYRGIMEYLRLLQYPKEGMPDIYFINPKGFKAKENLTESEISKIIRHCDFINDLAEESSHIQNYQDIIHGFKNNYKNLMRNKDQSVLLFDTCVHSGKTLQPVINMLNGLDFSDVRVGVVSDRHDTSNTQIDFKATNQEPEEGCYPFGFDKLVKKTFCDPCSKANDFKDDVEESIRLRKEIVRIVQQYWTQEETKS